MPLLFLPRIVHLFIILFHCCTLLILCQSENPEENAGTLQYLVPNVHPDVQTKSAQRVIQRIFPDRFEEFEIKVNPNLTGSPYKDTYTIEWNENKGKLSIKGTTGVSALLGLNQYLKYECNVQIAWEGSQLKLPQILPKVSIRRELLDRFRYYQNVCTDSYSFAWWTWTDWEVHIDWMALQGINLPLAFSGQEAIWEKVWRSFGFSEKEIFEYFTGPAFLAWFRMGNIEKFAGPIPRSFIEGKSRLLHQILRRMRSLGMMPILPSFNGGVPPAFTRLYPNVRVERRPKWSNFNETYSSTYLLDPNEPMFIDIGKKFIEEMENEYGTNHIYSCDTFNENRPQRNSSTYLNQIAQITYKSMSTGDSKAVWLLQSWAFTDTGFWGIEQVRSYLGGIPVGNAIVLDLQSELLPLYKPFKQFYNHSYVWCMLHNFGGTLGFYGTLSAVKNGLSDARENWNSTLVGTGICPEGINQNYIAYDFLFDTALDPYSMQIDEWVKSFSNRRYGISNPYLQNAWAILRIWYDIIDVKNSLESLLNASSMICKTSESEASLYSYDLVDFTRQFLQVLGSQIYNGLISSYSSKKTARFEKFAFQLLDLLDDLDEILKTNRKFMLGPHVEQATNWSEMNQEKALLRFNALNQITLWGYTGEISDYATKQWQGIVSSYYHPRWSLFIQALNDTSIPYKDKNFRQKVLNQVEIPFTKSMTQFPTIPQGGTLDKATKIYGKWKTIFVRLANKLNRRVRRKGTENGKRNKKKDIISNPQAQLVFPVN